MSGSEDEGQEKSLEATEKRREEARAKGDLPRAPDAQTALAYLGFTLAVVLSIRDAVTETGMLLHPFLAEPEELGLRLLAGEAGLHGGLAWRLFVASGPLLLAPAALIIVYLIATRSIVLAPDRVVPKLSRISPIENAGQKYGTHGLVEFAKSTTKLLALLVVLGIALTGHLGEIARGAHVEARLMARALESPLASVLGGALAVAILVGLADFFWQRHSHSVRLRMSHQEMKKELRDAEGDPQLKARRQDRAREIANNRMLDAVPKAAVVIANPTHFAVALAWNRAPGTAPSCVAKGVDEIALRIRERAEEADVPVQENPAVARALFATTEIGAEIAPEYYRAVAAAVLFADEMRARRRGVAITQPSSPPGADQGRETGGAGPPAPAGPAPRRDALPRPPPWDDAEATGR
ncbi:MAG: flagellar type III secretion system protein FlhB [Pseudomonadota bacterium]